MNSQEFSLAFSPCPNDTFMFDGLVNQRLQTNFRTRFDLLDIENLNKAALKNVYDFTKLSIGAYPYVASGYQIASSGCALGYKCGPLLIAREGCDLQSLRNKIIAIPGIYTTANLYLGILYPDLKNRKSYLFSEIEEAVLSGEADAGLIIHENRFTYSDKGLVKLVDLGEEWEAKTGLPVPLGCIAVKRSLKETDKIKFQEAIRNSIEMALSNPELSKPFVAANAQDMSDEVQQQHIALYVNKFSVALDQEGEEAIRYLFREGARLGLLPEISDSIFLNETFQKV